MELFGICRCLILSIYFLLATAEPVEFNATCWDMTTYTQGPRASRADILKLADKVSGNSQCAITKTDDVTLYKRSQGNVGDVYAYLLWTQNDINKGVYEVQYSCTIIASRIRTIANACATILETEYLSFWTVLNACDGHVVNTTRSSLPSIGESGIALNINGGKELMPDLKEKRRGKAFAKLKLLAQEDESPLPGWEAYPT